MDHYADTLQEAFPIVVGGSYRSQLTADRFDAERQAENQADESLRVCGDVHRALMKQTSHMPEAIPHNDDHEYITTPTNARLNLGKIHHPCSMEDPTCYVTTLDC